MQYSLYGACNLKCLVRPHTRYDDHQLLQRCSSALSCSTLPITQACQQPGCAEGQELNIADTIQRPVMQPKAQEMRENLAGQAASSALQHFCERVAKPENQYAALLTSHGVLAKDYDALLAKRSKDKVIVGGFHACWRQ